MKASEEKENGLHHEADVDLEGLRELTRDAGTYR